MRTIGLYFLIIAAAVMMSACTNLQGEDAKAKKFSLTDSTMRLIKIDTVKTEEVQTELKLNGKVTFDEEKVIKVYPMSSGNVVDVRAQLGDYVQSGEVLAVIKSGEIAGYEQQLINAEAALQMAQKNLNVTQDMYKSGISSEREFSQTQRDVQVAEAELNRVKALYTIYNIDKDKGSTFTLKAPISGFIVERKINKDMKIRPDNSDYAFTISGLKDVWVVANVFESDISKIHEGIDVSVSTLSYPDKIFPGKIDKVLNVLDPVSKVMKVRVTLSNPGYLLKPEMFAVVTAHYSENISLTAIPANSIIFDNSRNYVMVYKDRSTIETRDIDIYKSVNNRAYIKSGLIAGEKIISRNQLLIYDELND